MRAAGRHLPINPSAGWMLLTRTTSSRMLKATLHFQHNSESLYQIQKHIWRKAKILSQAQNFHWQSNDGMVTIPHTLLPALLGPETLGAIEIMEKISGP